MGVLYLSRYLQNPVNTETYPNYIVGLFSKVLVTPYFIFYTTFTVISTSDTMYRIQGQKIAIHLKSSTHLLGNSFYFPYVSFCAFSSPPSTSEAFPPSSSPSSLPVPPSSPQSAPSTFPRTLRGYGRRHYVPFSCRRSMQVSSDLPTDSAPFDRYSQCRTYPSCRCMAGRWSSFASLAALQVVPAEPLFLSLGQSLLLPLPV